MKFFDDMDRGCIHYNDTRINMVIDDNCRAWFDLVTVTSLLGTTDHVRSTELEERIKQRRDLSTKDCQCSESQNEQSQYTEARLSSSGRPDLAADIAAVMRPNDDEHCDPNKMYISEGGLCMMAREAGKADSHFAMWMFTKVVPTITQYTRHKAKRNHDRKIAVFTKTIETLKRRN